MIQYMSKSLRFRQQVCDGLYITYPWQCVYNVHPKRLASDESERDQLRLWNIFVLMIA